MKKFLVICALVATVASVAFIIYKLQPQPAPDSREAYEAFLRNHEYKEFLSEGEGEKEEEEEEKPDRPDLAFMQDYLRTMDPKTKRPHPESLKDMSAFTALLRDRKFAAAGRTRATSLSDLTQWSERGPKQVGGRTRAMLFDPNDIEHRKLWAGGVSGGLWYNDNITGGNSPWHKVDDFWDNLSVSCMAADPNNSSVIYVGTGEAHTNMRGGGIWKTTDGGVSWSRISSTEDFFLIRDIEIRNEGGISAIYAAVNIDYSVPTSPVNAGLYRSVDGGSNWTQVLPIVEFGSPNSPTDIEFGDDEIWVGTQPTYSNFSSNSLLYKSTTGTSGWTTYDMQVRGQIEIGVAPSNPNIVYAILEQDGAVSSIVKTVNNGSGWSEINKPVDADDGIPADDYTRGQAWYDLTIAVHPTKPNELLVGGIDLFKSTDGGNSWQQFSKWWSGIPITGPVVHADQHEILFRPGTDGAEAVFGNDGGVYYSSNLSAGTSSAKASPRNIDYNVTQFYTGAIHPTQLDYMLGGTQDNGTQRFTQPGFGQTTEAYGGDGALCFIDQLDPSIQIVSYVYNDVSISKDGGETFDQLILDGGSGHFINNGEYDSHQKILFTAKNASSVYKVKVSVANPNVQTMSIGSGLGSLASVMRVSPYNTAQSNLYIGTEAGRVFKVINASSASPVSSEITGPDFPNGSVSGIAFGANENQITITFSNYGVPSVWETTNGGSTWTNKEGNLPDMPVRWVEYHPHDPQKVYIATELGVWSTDNLSAASPVWEASNGGLANVRTDMLRIRSQDNTIMAATHGRGVFTAAIPALLTQTITFNELPEKNFGDPDFTLSASSTSSLAVSFSSSDPSIASITDNTVSIHKAGTVTISASQAGDMFYLPATTVNRTLIINKINQTITFESLGERNFGDEDFTLQATTTSNLVITFSSSDPTIASVDGAVLSVHKAGTVNITASQNGNDSYEAAQSVVQELVINKGQQTITFAALADVGINESTSTLTATASSNLTVSYTSSAASVATVNGNTLTIHGLGETEITASQPGNENYEVATSVIRVLKVVSRIYTMQGDLNFGEVIIGESARKDIRLTESGTAPVNYDHVIVPSAEFAVESSSDGDVFVLTVIFTPSQPKSYNGTFEIVSDATSGENTLPITAEGVSITDTEKDISSRLELFPNPVVNVVTITGADFSNVKSVEIADEKGALTTVNVQTSPNEMRVNVSNFASGIYMIGVPVNGKIYQKKFKK